MFEIRQIFNLNDEDCIWSPGQSSFSLRTMPMFPDFNRENQYFFLFNVQISSRVRSYIIRGPVNLKFGGRVQYSLVLNLNGEDRIWSPGSHLLV